MKYQSLQEVLDSRGVSMEFYQNFLLNLDELTEEEQLDFDYIADRIDVHLSIIGEED